MLGGLRPQGVRTLNSHDALSSYAMRPSHMPLPSGSEIWGRYPPQLSEQYRPYASPNVVLIVADGSRPDVMAQVYKTILKLTHLVCGTNPSTLERERLSRSRSVSV